MGKPLKREEPAAAPAAEEARPPALAAPKAAPPEGQGAAPRQALALAPLAALPAAKEEAEPEEAGKAGAQSPEQAIQGLLKSYESKDLRGFLSLVDPEIDSGRFLEFSKRTKADFSRAKSIQLWCRQEPARMDSSRTQAVVRLSCLETLDLGKDEIWKREPQAEATLLLDPSEGWRLAGLEGNLLPLSATGDPESLAIEDGTLNGKPVKGSENP